MVLDILLFINNIFLGLNFNVFRVLICCVLIKENEKFNVSIYVKILVLFIFYNFDSLN